MIVLHHLIIILVRLGVEEAEHQEVKDQVILKKALQILTPLKLQDQCTIRRMDTLHTNLRLHQREAINVRKEMTDSSSILPNIFQINI